MTNEKLAHYRIISKIGAGGMGEVYLAEDTRLGRQVALKLLPERYTQNPERVRRFEQEARAASALSHPNIITIFEIGQAEGRHFIATEFVAGQTLRQVLLARRLELQKALDIGLQIAAALTAAHGARITHRDIKPENIMLRADGYVKVLDFGLAKLIEAAPEESGGDDPLITQAETAAEDLFATAGWRQGQETSPGVILGTLNYMSPEQARGLKVDARTDIFSLGIVLYEMLAGRAPFEGPTSSDILVAILERTPPPLTHSTPAELEWIVNKALAKDREERYQAVKVMHGDLQRLQKRLQFEASLSDAAKAYDSNEFATRELTAPLADEAVFAAGEFKEESGAPSTTGRVRSGARRSSGASTAPPPIDTLAVLPFAHASSDTDAAILSEGLAESLIMNLSRLPQLRVRAWSTVARYQGKDVDALQIGRELGVRAVLTGRMFQFGENLVIKTELVDTSDGAQLWGEQYQRQFTDLFTIEEEIAQEMAEKLRLRLNSEERQRLAKRYTENNAAYQAYLTGRYYWSQRNARALRKAIECFEQAIALDQDYALAYAGLADCYAVISIYGAAPPRAVLPRAKAAAQKALTLDDGLAEAHTSLAVTLVWFEWDWAAAEQAFRRAHELNPNYANGYHWYGSVFLSSSGRHDEALAAELRAQEIEPFSLVFATHLGFICYQAHWFEEAVAYLRKAVEMDEHFILARFYLGLAYAQQKRFDEALAELQRAFALAGRGALLQAGLGYVYAAANRRAEALQLLAQLQTFPLNRDVSPFCLALIYAGLGEQEQALKFLEDAYEERFSWVVWLKHEPMFESLRSDERFVTLMRRVGLT